MFKIVEEFTCSEELIVFLYLEINIFRFSTSHAKLLCETKHILDRLQDFFFACTSLLSSTRTKVVATGKALLVSFGAFFILILWFYLFFFFFQAANYLCIKSLLDLACQTVAEMIKEKTPVEIRNLFNIKNDFTEEEEEAIRKEHAWAFE